MTRKNAAYCKLIPQKERIFWTCEVKKTTHKSNGLFALESIPKGVVFAIDGGTVYDSPLVIAGKNYGVLVDEEKYLYTPDMENPTPLCFLNHSCTPNLARIGGLVFVTKKHIPAGKEITVDYAPLVAGLKKWKMSCNCGSKHCRQIISSKDWQNPRLAKQLWQEWLPFIQKKIICRS